MIKKYVLGFLFRGQEVALISKNRPDWQKGMLNGIGGQIKNGESPAKAMRREFHEETGSLSNSWEYFCTMYFPEATVWCFRNFDHLNIETKTDEMVGWYQFHHLPDVVIPNLRWLIPLALYCDTAENIDRLRFSMQVENKFMMPVAEPGNGKPTESVSYRLEKTDWDIEARRALKWLARQGINNQEVKSAVNKRLQIKAINDIRRKR